MSASAESGTSLPPAAGAESQRVPGIPGRRRHGFEAPFDELQIATWLIFPLIVAHYFAFLYFLLWDSVAAKAVLTAVFGLAALTTLFCAHRTCSVDPADDALCVPTSSSSSSRREGERRDEIYCYLCEVDVNATSKHCRFCNKCVRNFDHHCKWLNTCVGEKNYRFFLGVVAAVLLLTSESLALSIALLVEAFASPAALRKRALRSNDFGRWLGSEPDEHALQALLVSSVAVLLCVVALVVQLCGFHAVLLYKGMTTYDFIVAEQKKQRERETARAEKQLEMQRAKSDSERRAPQQSSRESESESDAVAVRDERIENV